MAVFLNHVHMCHERSVLGDWVYENPAQYIDLQTLNYKMKIIVLYSNFETLEVKQENEEAVTETLRIMTK